jgi:hypothetical protein
LPFNWLQCHRFLAFHLAQCHGFIATFNCLHCLILGTLPVP